MAASRQTVDIDRATVILDELIFEPGTNRARRRAHANHHFREVRKHRATRSHHCPLTDCYAGRDEYVRGHPYLILDHDRRRLHVKGGATVVVSSGAEIAFLRHYGIFANCDFGETVKHHVVAYPRIITDLEFPGVRDRDAGTDNDTLADCGPE